MARRQGVTREHVPLVRAGLALPVSRVATQAPGHFQLNPPGPGSLGEFLRRSLGQYRNGYRRFARFLKFAQAPCSDWQAIPVTQH